MSDDEELPPKEKKSRSRRIKDTAKDIVDLATGPLEKTVLADELPEKIRGVPVNRHNIKEDPLNIDVRTYIQVHEMLLQVERDIEVSLRERIAALALIERLRPKDTIPDDISGSAVRKYAGAFSQDGSGRRKAIARPASKPESGDSWFDRDGVLAPADDDLDGAGDDSSPDA